MVPQDRRRSRKDEFLDLAIDQLMATGLNDLSLRDIATHLGTSHRVLIYHFGSKENLINLAVQEVRRRERQQFEVQTVSTGAPDLRASLTLFFDHNLSQGMRAYFRLLYQVWGIAQAQPEKWEQFLDGIVFGWVDSLTEVFVTAGYDPDTARIRATLVLATLRGLQLDLFTTHDDVRVKDAFDALVDFILGEAATLAPSSAGPDGKHHQDN
ncbi:AcrR family transcriptional regulator [Microbacteriaceae bacterium SG_E_30_P1]|uniref:AcrR family transcriptional regulator n=1 Tax=Antiquaquibacter oligotrophicus TaxID=2880260 RepID=A0ABT6KR59_9MICO|nr:TetR/AcrR family transcriptional regulator [Antiquaquibacter oligotrophicus]MDH6182463.1 AcrR family transcriptional regulator [Antiquaquibacter oligotrophicus]UDF14566.1 TetR/AcrR family transcriptional regulator [Antiquaquibacter oligotrophicus]